MRDKRRGESTNLREAFVSHYSYGANRRMGRASPLPAGTNPPGLKTVIAIRFTNPSLQVMDIVGEKIIERGARIEDTVVGLR